LIEHKEQIADANAKLAVYGSGIRPSKVLKSGSKIPEIISIRMEPKHLINHLWRYGLL